MDRKGILVRVPADLRKQARIKSVQCGETLNSVLERALQEYVNGPKPSKSSSKSGC